MQFLVTKHYVTLKKREDVNEGEYKVTKCKFDFDEHYDGLVKKAVFTNLSMSGAYEMPILEGECDIPEEVLQRKGVIKIGVYAYEVSGQTMVLRYSPMPAYIEAIEGSYIRNPMNPGEVTPTQFEQYEMKLNEGLEEVENVDIDAEKVGHTATITITNRDGETKSVEIYDGTSGGGGGGTSNFNDLSNRPKYAGTEMTGETNIPSVPNSTSQLVNDSDFQTSTDVSSAVSSAVSAAKNEVTSYITDATEYSADSSYALGDYAIYQGIIYQCNTPIVGGEAWNASHWSAVNSIQEQLDNTETWTFTLSDNTTVTKKVVVR